MRYPPSRGWWATPTLAQSIPTRGRRVGVGGVGRKGGGGKQEDGKREGGVVAERGGGVVVVVRGGDMALRGGDMAAGGGVEAMPSRGAVALMSCDANHAAAEALAAAVMSLADHTCMPRGASAMHVCGVENGAFFFFSRGLLFCGEGRSERERRRGEWG